MIPSTNNKLLVAEDWTKIYQSFKNADFKSYDFDTLRRVMIQYLRDNYPEEFNDYIDSSEFIALVDLIAYLGQNLSFRIDLNARENFLETAQRKDSVLRLAQLISYSPKRNIPATGFLKLTALATSDNIFDSNNTNLANQTIVWNDVSNTNWYQQFITVIGSAMPGSGVYGQPADSGTIDGIATEQYKINSENTDVPVYSFTKSINGVSMGFEIVSAGFKNQKYIYEETPVPGSNVGLIFKNDNKGAGSANTGFFFLFKQGTLSSQAFNIDRPVADEIVGVNVNDINNSDVWLWQLDSAGNYSTEWTKVSSVVGNNVIYNSINLDNRTFFAVSTRNNDQIDLNFADGNFGNLPKGAFRLFYRQSNGLRYVISPDAMNGITLRIPYRNKAGQSHVLTLTLSLQYSVINSAPSETIDSIKKKAPQNYYIQNRMVTAEDYNVAPITIAADILKVKSINRQSSGISKYFDLTDVTGKYSQTDIFAHDGIIYKEDNQKQLSFTFTTRNEAFGALKHQVEPLIESSSFRNFYFDKFPRADLTNISIDWTFSRAQANQTRGYFKNKFDSTPTQLGYFSSNNAMYIKDGALVKFTAPSITNGNTVTPQYFLPNGKLTSIKDGTTRDYIWTKVVKVVGDGANSGLGLLYDGTGPVILTGYIPNGAVATECIPPYQTTLSYALENEIVNQMTAKRNFGLSFDRSTREWFIIVDTNLDLKTKFNLIYQGDTSNLNIDSSWQIALQWTGKSYTVFYRETNYLFESNQQTGFFVDTYKTNFDFVSNSVIKDKISVLGINTLPNTTTTSALGYDYNWQIDNSIVENDGYIEPKKVAVSFFDAKNDGQIDDPDSFEYITASNSVSLQTGFKNNFVYFQNNVDGLRYKLVNADLFTAVSEETDVVGTPTDGQLFYFYSADVIKYWSSTNQEFILTTEYFARPGRSNLKFHYLHNSGTEKRIDPAKTNIIDIFILTGTYDTEFRRWLSVGGTPPLTPTISSLEDTYSQYLEPIKSVSDTIVYHPAKYKILFGDRAPTNLQATFRASRNSNRSASDNDLKTRIISAVNEFFAIENWNFGDTFHFSELSTYVMNVMTPDITNFIIVSNNGSAFGNLYEIVSQTDEIFVSGLTVNDIEIIGAVTPGKLTI